MGLVSRPAIENAPHPFFVFRVPDTRRPIGRDIDKATSVPQHPVYFAGRLPEITRVFDHLDTVNGVEIAVLIRQFQQVPDLTLHPSESGTTFVGGGISIAETWPVGPTN